ncbi:hypothetical protein N0V90_010573 [Kalmusia sp. IMI 367209]|nr:hypothetical protein N0V90_010573 [Kalmusia sp. IMI 367209]
MNNAVLGKNIFSLKLPRVVDDVGEYMLGDSNPDLYTGDVRKVKLLADDNIPGDHPGVWNVPVESVTVNTSVPFYQSLSNFTATIISEPIVAFPASSLRSLYEIIGARPTSMLRRVPFDSRPYLPELTFNIGGHNLTINAFDYTFEVNFMLDDPLACMTWFEEIEDLGLGDNTVALGSTFLKGFYTIFDFGQMEIGYRLITTFEVEGSGH